LQLLYGIADNAPTRRWRNQWKEGNTLILQTFDRREIMARLVAVRGRVALVCSEEEWSESQRQGCEPIVIGWPLGDVREARSQALPVVDQNIG
jgi:hypothetical protein